LAAAFAAAFFMPAEKPNALSFEQLRKQCRTFPLAPKKYDLNVENPGTLFQNETPLLTELSDFVTRVLL
jgi:hypothetical protein